MNRNKTAYGRKEWENFLLENHWVNAGGGTYTSTMFYNFVHLTVSLSERGGSIKSCLYSIPGKIFCFSSSSQTFHYSELAKKPSCYTPIFVVLELVRNHLKSTIENKSAFANNIAENWHQPVIDFYDDIEKALNEELGRESYRVEHALYQMKFERTSPLNSMPATYYRNVGGGVEFKAFVNATNVILSVRHSFDNPDSQPIITMREYPFTDSRVTGKETQKFLDDCFYEMRDELIEFATEKDVQRQKGRFCTEIELKEFLKENKFIKRNKEEILSLAKEDLYTKDFEGVGFRIAVWVNSYSFTVEMGIKGYIDTVYSRVYRFDSVALCDDETPEAIFKTLLANALLSAGTLGVIAPPKNMSVFSR